MISLYLIGVSFNLSNAHSKRMTDKLKESHDRNTLVLLKLLVTLTERLGCAWNKM